MTVYTALLGGLGNQMFQYAAGRALALRKQVPLKLDTTGFAAYRLHQGFELQRVFSCGIELASRADIRNVLGWQATPLVRRVLQKPLCSALRKHAFVVEPHFQYWPEINHVPDACYLSGYWQSERYFKDAEAVIRADFSFRQPLSSVNEQVAEHMQRVNAVSLHVRRGDYVSDSRTHATHGVCPADYYAAAMQHMAERVDNVHFFVFSDDMQWVREYLQFEHPVDFMEHNRGEASHNDMHLMSLCKHHIIANSSFSWWGAWLNPRADKKVIAPQKWFANNNVTDDLYPPGWTRL